MMTDDHDWSTLNGRDKGLSAVQGEVEPSPVMIEEVANAIRLGRFERTGRGKAYDPKQPLHETELADARAAIVAMTAARQSPPSPVMMDADVERAIHAVAELEMDREGVPYSRIQEEFYKDAGETVDAVLAALATIPNVTAVVEDAAMREVERNQCAKCGSSHRDIKTPCTPSVSEKVPVASFECPYCYKTAWHHHEPDDIKGVMPYRRDRLAAFALNYGAFHELDVLCNIYGDPRYVAAPNLNTDIIKTLQELAKAEGSKP